MVDDTVVDLLKELYGSMVDVHKMRHEIAVDAKQDFTDSPARGAFVGVSAALIAAFIPMLLIATVLACLRAPHKVPSKTRGGTMSCCSVCIYLLVFYLMILGGVMLGVSIIFNDVCDHMLEGNAASNGRGLIEINMERETFDVGNTTVVMSDFIVQLLECPAGCTLEEGVSIGCDAKNNMVDLMNVRNEFDFNSKTRDATRDLSKSIDELEQSPLSEATEAMASTDISDALALDLTQQWDGESFISALNAMPLTEEVTAARTAAEDVNAKVAAISDTQQQLQSDVQSVNTAIDELDATLMETVQNLRQVVQDFNTLADEAMNGAAGATRCDWMGRAYDSIVQANVCKVPDQLGVIGTVAMFAAAELYLAVLVLVYTTRRMEEDYSDDANADFRLIPTPTTKEEGVSLAPGV